MMDGSSKLSPDSLPRSFRNIRLELARENGHPTGSREIGYTIVAPLDAEGRIDVDLWRHHRAACRVVRFRPDEESDFGHLVHRQRIMGISLRRRG